MSETPTIKIRFGPDPVVCNHDKVGQEHALEFAESKVIKETAFVLGNTMTTINNVIAATVKHARE